ncbi:MAG: PD-(D/E)XK nuclease family protein [Dehalococcoidales bacterium]|nr:PD-(D/E)XK nuclease family protein [Dehalococcoidales bacterium]
MSFSQISLYQTCPLCYKFQYVDKLKPREKSYLSFGTTIHACIEYFLKARTPPPLEKLLDYYEKNWLSGGYASAEEEQGYKDYGRQILRQFWETHYPGFHPPAAVEKSFYIDVEGVKVQGFFDRVDKLPSGGLAITDYKTNRELFTTEYLANNLQLTIYQIAAEKTWGLPVERLTLYHLVTNTPCSCPPRGREQVEAAQRLILEVAEKITRGHFPAVENDTCPCDFTEHCPYYRHLYLTAGEVLPKESPAVAIGEVVESYVSLQSRIKELEKQLEETRQTIIEYCEKEGISRIFGTRHEVTYHLVKRTGFDEEEVRRILEPADLWGRVLGFDESLVKKLLADGTVPGHIRRQLEAAERIISSHPYLRVRPRTEEE